MKTLKKTLCLVLAVVMVVGVLILPAYAADDYTAATTALQNYGVLQGYPDGDLHTAANITRGQMAAIIYRIMTGDTSSTDAEVAVKYGSYADRFTDADVAPWAKGYIGFCYNKGVLKGYDTGAVQPNKQINGYEVQAMLLRALGYDSNGEYTGNNWQYNVLSDATKSGISKNVSLDPAKATPRGAVAQYTFDAATKTDRVAPTLVPNVGYASIGKKLMSITSADDYDDWGAPSTIYTITYTWPDYAVTTSKAVPDEPVAEYWTPVAQTTVFADAKLKGTAAISFDTYANGNKDNTAQTITYGVTTTIGGQGRWTRVYSDRIVYVDTFLSKVTDVTEAVKVNGATAISASYETTTYYNYPAVPTAATDKNSKSGTTSFAKGDMLASNAIATKAVFDAADQISKLVNTAKATTATVTVKAIVKADNQSEVGIIGTNGVTYLYNCTYGYNGGSSVAKLTDKDIDTTFTLYLDAHNNILGVEPEDDSNSGYGVVLDFNAGKIKAKEYYGILTILTKDNTQVTVNFIDAVASDIAVVGTADQKPYTSEDAALDAAEALVGNLVHWEDDKAAADDYPGYSLITAADNGKPTTITGSAGNSNLIQAGDSKAINASKAVNDKTVFFVANYTMSNSKGGYVFSNYSVVKGFQNIMDLSYTTNSKIVDNPNAKATGTSLEVQTILDKGWVAYALVISDVAQTTNQTETVKNYAFLAQPNAFVDVYDDYYEYDAVINGVAHQPLKVTYTATGEVNGTALYTYGTLTNGSWSAVEPSTNLLKGIKYTDGVIIVDTQATLTTPTVTGPAANDYLTVAKDAAIYIVNPSTGASTKVDVSMSTILAKDSPYKDAQMWYQLNEYGWINVIYVESEIVGDAGSADKDVTAINVTVPAATPTYGSSISSAKVKKTIDGDHYSVSYEWQQLVGNNWGKVEGNAFGAGTFRLVITIKPDSGYRFTTSTTYAATGAGASTLGVDSHTFTADDAAGFTITGTQFNLSAG